MRRRHNVVSTLRGRRVYPSGLTEAHERQRNITGTLINVSGGVLNAVYSVTPASASGRLRGHTFKNYRGRLIRSQWAFRQPRQRSARRLDQCEFHIAHQHGRGKYV